VTNLRLGFIVGAPCPAELERRITSKMHIRDVMIGCGMTEASGGVSQTSRGDTLERRVKTVGRAHPHTEIKIIDPAGETEEFLFRHPAIADVHGFSVPDEHFGEELCVWIKLRDGAIVSEEDIRAFCRGQITHFHTI